MSHLDISYLQQWVGRTEEAEDIVTPGLVERFRATLADIISPSIAFRNADAHPSEDPLCVYNLDSHDKISHLKSVIMCKLYRSSRSSGWHVLAVGDSHPGSADNYGPIYKAIQGIL